MSDAEKLIHAFMTTAYKHDKNSNVKCLSPETLIHKLIHEHDFCPVGLLFISCGGEDDTSHDSTLIHNSYRLQLCYCFE